MAETPPEDWPEGWELATPEEAEKCDEASAQGLTTFIPIGPPPESPPMVVAMMDQMQATLIKYIDEQLDTEGVMADVEAVLDQYFPDPADRGPLMVAIDRQWDYFEGEWVFNLDIHIDVRLQPIGPINITVTRREKPNEVS
jgi:hypothetical protein